MQEVPRLSSALRAKAGVRPVPLEQQVIARIKELQKLTSSSASSFSSTSSSSSKSSSSFNWPMFAGPAFNLSTDPQVRSVRTSFNTFLGDVSEVVGGGDAVLASALIVFVHCSAWLDFTTGGGASGKGTPEERQACARLAKALHVTLSVQEFQKLCAAAAPLNVWRKRNNVLPILDAKYLLQSSNTSDDAEGVSTSTSTSSSSSPSGGFSPGGFHFYPIDSAAQSNTATTIMNSTYAPFSVIHPFEGGDSDNDDEFRSYEHDEYNSLSNLDSVAHEWNETKKGQNANRSSSSSSSQSATDEFLVGRPVDAVWLYAQCAQFVLLTGSALSAENVGLSILDTVKKNMKSPSSSTSAGYSHHQQSSSTTAATTKAVNIEQLQSGLFDVLGEQGIEFMSLIVQHHVELSAVASQDFKRICAAVSQVMAAQNSGGGGLSSRARPVMGAGVSVINAAERARVKETRKLETKLARANKALVDLGAIHGNDSGDDLLLTGGVIDMLANLGFSEDYLASERSLGLQGGELPPTYGASRAKTAAISSTAGALTGGSRVITADEAIAAVGAGFAGATKRALPAGTTDTMKDGLREVVVPAPVPVGNSTSSSSSRGGGAGAKGAGGGGRGIFNLVSVSEMDPIGRQAFLGIEELNRLQSELFEAAYRSNENLLVCAPTGAGKTNVAMLTVVRELLAHATRDGQGVNKHDDFKIIYVAPMKALAQEVVAKFGQRLSSLGIVVKELTGDMQLTKAEIAETQVIVTTPEKWDVITRKGGDNALVALVRLLIIDEVHLLADTRGAVIESIVARTLRLVETSQSVIRIVGLSATLPNYQDVALFLRVNPTRGLFYFDSSYRPVPLQQTFIGVSEMNSLKRLTIMNKVAWDKAVAAVKKGKQVMVFVHSRKDTGKTARALRDLAAIEGAGRLLSPFGGEEGEEESGGGSNSGSGVPSSSSSFIPSASTSSGATTITSTIQGEGRISLTQSQWVAMQKDVEKSRNQELRELFVSGFGIHHAGMLRSDRSLTERMFAAGVIKILCCTATLAWGVNLPAHTVIIKGTQVYDAEAGGFQDLGMLDVMQIFGRAGRPQFDISGEGIIITGGEKLGHYLSLLTATIPIESSFIKSLPDHLNAEIASGTVSNVREAVMWLSYTYLYVRMLRNPLGYGINHDEKATDPLLEAKRISLITLAAKRLDECHMIRYDGSSGNFGVTDLGRVASHYYVVNESVDTFNKMVAKVGFAVGKGAAVSDEEVFALVCNAHEFAQIKVRDEELGELDHLKGETRIAIKGDVASTVGKVNVLLQAYIGNVALRSFTLISDTAYITQSAGRISRALFEISLKKGWYTLAERMLTLSKAIDKRLWWTASPLRQFPWSLAPEIIRKLEDTSYAVDELADMDPGELGAIVRHPTIGPKISSLIQQVPRLQVETSVQPITRTILRLTVTIWPAFNWNDRISGTAEPWWLWVEDAQSERMYHSEYVLLQRRQAVSGEPLKLVFAIPVFEPLPTQYWLRILSDRWLGVESVVEISFRHLILPTLHPPHTDLLDLLPLPLAALENTEYEALYARSFTHFNPVQTQMFFTVYRTDTNVLLGAPTGSGKTVAAELAVFRLFSAHRGKKAVYIAPLKALVSERMKDWQRKLGDKLGKKVVELTGDVTPDIAALQTADVIITTPEKWDGITRFWKKRNYVQKVGLVIIDEIHLLGEDRGPVLEVIVSRMRYIASRTGQEVRFVGLSTALSNAHDVADWLGSTGSGLFNFRPSVRPIPMQVHVRGFPGKHYCPRMATMNKPAFADIATYSPDKPVLIFVASRRQTRLTALDLISLCATADNPRRFLRMTDDEISLVLEKVKDTSLKHTLAFGVGIHHAGLCESDRSIVEDLFCAVKIQVLCCTATLAWGVNFPAHLVIVKGTEFYDAKTSRYVDFPVTDVLQMMGRAGRPQFDTHGVAVIMVHEPKKDFYRKFLYDPFPVESQLHKQLEEHINAEIAGGAIASRHDAVEYLTWTYFFRRLLQNPTYYDLEDSTPEGVKEYLYNVVDAIFAELEDTGCVVLGDEAIEAREGEGGGAATSSSTRGGGSGASEADAVATTTLGTITSYYYLHHTTAAIFADRLAEESSPEDSSNSNKNKNKKSKMNGLRNSVQSLARLLTSAPEFSELPVRHNEDELNATFAQSLPWIVADKSWNSPHTKAFLLLQARLSRSPLPITDYLTDTKSVMDQSLRVCAALMDVAADGGHLGATLGIAQMIQCILQARMPEEDIFFQLPHLENADPSATNALYSLIESQSSFALMSSPSSADSAGQLVTTITSSSPLRALAQLPEDTIRTALTKSNHNSNNKLSSTQLSEVLRVLRGIPVVSASCRIANVDGGSGGSSRQGMAVARLGSEVVLQVDIRVRASASRRAYLPRYNRPKEYGWWIIVGTGKNTSRKQQQKTTVVVPREKTKKSTTTKQKNKGAGESSEDNQGNDNAATTEEAADEDEEYEVDYGFMEDGLENEELLALKRISLVNNSSYSRNQNSSSSSSYQQPDFFISSHEVRIVIPDSVGSSSSSSSIPLRLWLLNDAVAGIDVMQVIELPL